MLNKEKFLQTVKQEDRMLVSKVLDKIEFTEKSRQTSYTDFLDMYQQKTLVRLFTSEHITYVFDGGYPEAERKIAVIMNGKNSDCEMHPIELLEIEYKGKPFIELNHRDVLGSVMSLGIKRDKIGDIIISNDNCQMIVHKDISDYILMNLEKIKNANVTVKKDDINSVKPALKKFREITGFIPSLRLDCIVEEGFSISRSEAAQLIKDEKVFVDWEPVNKISYEVKPESIISARGMGRLLFEEVSGKTRKDRLVVKLKRFI